MNWKDIKMADRLTMLKAARKDNPESTYWDIRNKYNDGKSSNTLNVDKYNEQSVIDLPEISKYNVSEYSEYDDFNNSTIGSIVKLFDPTGITSWPDVDEADAAFNKEPTFGNFANVLIETVGAIPLVSTAGRSLKILSPFAGIKKRGGAATQLIKELPGMIKDAYDSAKYINNKNKPIQTNPVPYKIYKFNADKPEMPVIPEFTQPPLPVTEEYVPKKQSQFDRYTYLHDTGSFIKANENPYKKGYDKKTNTWSLYDNRTGGYGFDIISNNRIKEKFGNRWTNKQPISNKEVDNMFSTVLNDFAQYVENRYEKINGTNSIKTLPNNIYTTLVDYAYQHGNLPQSLVKAAGSKDLRSMETILRKHDNKYPKRLQQRLKKLYE